MEQQIISNGGVQYVPQVTAVQYVYLDFDGELTSYDGEILTVDNVVVEDSKISAERIADIAAELNAKYASQNVVFVTEKPQNAEYSTVYIGKASAFEQYGNFSGLAETIDKGNVNKTDKAFVLLNSTSSNKEIIATISHETDHLLGTLDHGGEALGQYACTSHAAILNSSWNGSSDIWYIGHSYVLYPYGFSRCAASNCSSTFYEFDNISGATITNGTYRICSSSYISQTVIGSGAFVHLQTGTKEIAGTYVTYFAHADKITVTNGGYISIGTACSATNITLRTGGGVVHGWTDLLLTHHGSAEAYISDFNQNACVYGRIDNFDFNGELNAC